VPPVELEAEVEFDFAGPAPPDDPLLLDELDSFEPEPEPVPVPEPEPEPEPFEPESFEPESFEPEPESFEPDPSEVDGPVEPDDESVPDVELLELPRLSFL
jgi:hypothetical protein